MIVAGDRGYGAWRDGGFTIHDLSDPRAPKLLSHINWSPPFPGGTHTALPLPGRNLAVVADEANAEKLRQGHVPYVRRGRARAGEPGARSRPCRRRRTATTARSGKFGPHNLHENRPGSFRSEDTIFATYNNAGVRVFDIKDAVRAEGDRLLGAAGAGRLIDPRPNVSLAAKTADIYVTTGGLMYVSDWNAGLNVLQYQG